MKDVVEWDVKPVKLYMAGSRSYYYLTGLETTFGKLDNAEGKTYYILVYDSGANSVELFSLGSSTQIEDNST